LRKVRAASGRRVGPAFAPGFLFVISSKMPQHPRPPGLVRCEAARGFMIPSFVHHRDMRAPILSA
jgi:hypothetical protein